MPDGPDVPVPAGEAAGMGPLTGETRRTKPKKDADVLARPEASKWGQADLIMNAAGNDGGGWHTQALGGIMGFLDDRALSDMATGAELNEQAEHEAARVVYERVLRDMEKTKGPWHPYTARALNGLATALAGLERYEEARPQGERAVAVYAAAAAKLGEGPASESETHQALADLADARNNLGVIMYKMRSSNGEARRLFEEALAGYRQLFGPAHAMVARTLKNLGNTMKRDGDNASALDAYGEALKIYGMALGPYSSARAMTLNNLANVLKKELRFDDAVDHYRRALHCYAQVSERIGAEARRGQAVSEEEAEVWGLGGRAAVVRRRVDADASRTRHNLANVL